MQDTTRTGLQGAEEEKEDVSWTLTFNQTQANLLCF